MIQKSSNLNLVNTRAEIYSMTTFIILLFVCIIQRKSMSQEILYEE